MGTYSLFSPFLGRILPPNDTTELPCCSCCFVQEQGMCSHWPWPGGWAQLGASHMPLLWASKFHPFYGHDSAPILNPWLGVSQKFWDILSCDTFRLPLLRFLFLQLFFSFFRLDSSWILSLYSVWLLISFIFSTFLSLWATSWIISPVQSFSSQRLSLRGVCPLSNVSIEFLNFYFISLFSRSSVSFFYLSAYLLLIFERPSSICWLFCPFCWLLLLVPCFLIFVVIFSCELLIFLRNCWKSFKAQG